MQCGERNSLNVNITLESPSFVMQVARRTLYGKNYGTCEIKIARTIAAICGLWLARPKLQKVSERRFLY